MIEKRKLRVLHIVIYLLLFFTTWSIKELVIVPVWFSQFDELTWHVSEASIKLLVWMVPALFLIRHFQDDMWISLDDMFTNKSRFSKGWLILLFVLFPLISALFIHGEIAIRPGFESNILIWMVPGVIIEEVVFRGFLLNTMLKRMKVWQAVMIDAILFTLIHFPIWIYWGLDVFAIILNGVQMLPVSVLFAFSFIKTKSIIVPIVIHLLWNILTLLFVV